MKEGTVMTTAQVGYRPVHRWVKHILGSTHTTVVVTVAWAVLCLLGAQRVTAAALARALPAEHAGSGRSCLRRGRGRGGGAGPPPGADKSPPVPPAPPPPAAGQPPVAAGKPPPAPLGGRLGGRGVRCRAPPP